MRRVARRRDVRRFGPGPYILGLRWKWSGEGFPFDVPAVAAVERLSLDAPVLMPAGDNGTGKSTLVEAIAEAMGFAAQGGELERSGQLPAVPRPVLDGALEPVLARTKRAPARASTCSTPRASPPATTTTSTPSA